ncbi:hypothetical protein WA158_005782 [Blastocystis sp. Blastoise]
MRDITIINYINNPNTVNIGNYVMSYNERPSMQIVNQSNFSMNSYSDDCMCDSDSEECKEKEETREERLERLEEMRREEETAKRLPDLSSQHKTPLPMFSFSPLVPKNSMNNNTLGPVEQQKSTTNESIKPDLKHLQKQDINDNYKIIDIGDKYLIYIKLCGVREEDVECQLDDNQLSISYKRSIHCFSDELIKEKFMENIGEEKHTLLLKLSHVQIGKNPQFTLENGMCYIILPKV